MALDILYVFFNGGHAHGLRFPIKIHLPGENRQKPPKTAKNGLF